MQIPVPVATVGLLVLSNVFMTFAWYGHLKHKSMALPMVIFISWCIAFSSTCCRSRPTASVTATSTQRN